MEQHVGDAGDGDLEVAGAWRHRKAADRGLVGGAARLVHGAVAEGDTCAGQPDLAEHGGERHQGPERLLSVLRALEGPGRGQHDPAAAEPPGQGLDAFGRDAGDGGGPLGGLGRAVVLAREVGADTVVADAAAVEEPTVRGAVALGRVGEGQDQRGVRVGANRQPLGAERVGGVGAERGDVGEPGAAPARAVHQRREAVPAAAAGLHLPVLRRQAAEGQELVAVREHGVPFRDRAGDGLRGAEQMRHEDHAGAEAVVRHLAGAAAGDGHEAVQQGAGVVEAAGGGPAVGAAEDGGRAVPGADPAQLTGHQAQRPVPAHGHEGVLAAARAVTPEPAAADHGLRDAVGGVEHLRPRLVQLVGLPVVLERTRADQAAVLDQGGEGAPVGGGAEGVGHGAGV